jgi:hypothetical protein
MIKTLVREAKLQLKRIKGHPVTKQVNILTLKFSLEVIMPKSYRT